MYPLKLTLLSSESLQPIATFENDTLAARVNVKLGLPDLCGMLPQQYETGSGEWRAEDLIALATQAKTETTTLIRHEGLKPVEIPWSQDAAKTAADDPMRQGGVENFTMGDTSMIRYMTNKPMADPDRAPLEADLDAFLVFLQSGLAANAILRNGQFAPLA